MDSEPKHYKLSYSGPKRVLIYSKIENASLRYHGHKLQTLFQKGHYSVAKNKQQLSRLPTTLSTLKQASNQEANKPLLITMCLSLSTVKYIFRPPIRATVRSVWMTQHCRFRLQQTIDILTKVTTMVAVIKVNMVTW